MSSVSVANNVVQIASALSVAVNSSITGTKNSSAFIPDNYDNVNCRNPDGDYVEWFIMYKVPKMKVIDESGRFQFEVEGKHFGYLDSTTPQHRNIRWAQFDDITSKEKNPLYNTLALLFDKSKDFISEKNLSFASYYDKPADLSNETVAKGVYLFGEESGFWLTYSFERPLEFFKSAFEIPEQSMEKSQTVLCISMKSESLPKIVTHMRQASVKVRDFYKPQMNETEDQPFFGDETPLSSPTGTSTSFFKGTEGQSFVVFAKNSTHEFDLYETMIAPLFDSNIYLRGFEQNEEDRLVNFCLDKDIHEVRDVELKLGDNLNVRGIDQKKDNSKWAVSEKDFWVCFGSVGRSVSYVKHGAEAFCFKNKQANILVANSIETFEGCERISEEASNAISSHDPGSRSTYHGRRGIYISPLYIYGTRSTRYNFYNTPHYGSWNNGRVYVNNYNSHAYPSGGVYGSNHFNSHSHFPSQSTYLNGHQISHTPISASKPASSSGSFWSGFGGGSSGRSGGRSGGRGGGGRGRG